jgi:hypothetical protein
MTEDGLQSLINESQSLTLDEQLQLMKQLEQRVRSHNQAKRGQFRTNYS